LGGLGLALGLSFFGACGLGGVFGILAGTASRELSGALDMAHTYGKEKESLRKASLPKRGVNAAGVLVRAFAEIEDIVNLWIMRLAETTEGMSAILMGRMGLSAKLQTVEYLAKIHGPPQTTIFKNLFGPGFPECKQCRDAMAHGVLLGKSKETGRYAFLTNNTLDPLEPKLTREVISYDLEDLETFAAIAKASIPAMEEALGLQSLRQRYLRQSLLPHRKGQPPKTSGDKPKRQQSASPRKPPQLSVRQWREALTKAASERKPPQRKMT
jgi:hypothetical protein